MFSGWIRYFWLLLGKGDILLYFLFYGKGPHPHWNIILTLEGDDEIIIGLPPTPQRKTWDYFWVTD